MQSHTQWMCPWEMRNLGKRNEFIYRDCAEEAGCLEVENWHMYLLFFVWQCETIVIVLRVLGLEFCMRLFHDPWYKHSIWWWGFYPYAFPVKHLCYVRLIFLLDIAIGDCVLNSARILVEVIMYLIVAYNWYIRRKNVSNVSLWQARFVEISIQIMYCLDSPDLTIICHC